jgi:hypothetical protein
MRTFAAKSEARPAANLTALGPIQTRLAVQKQGDACEREADRLSEHVMRSGGTDQRAAPLQTSRAPPAAGSDHVGAPSVVRDVLQSPGQPMDPATRAFVEPRFGHDFGRIRVHSDDKAAASARSVNALAFASGRHLVFGAGQYAPDTGPGRRLLAHELIHSLQQGMGAQSPAPSIDGAAAPLVQRQVAVGGDVGAKEEVGMRVQSAGGPAYGLRNRLQALLDNKVTDYIQYHDTIAKSTPAERQFALERRPLLSAMNDTLGGLSFARLVELLGRRAPNFDELVKNKVVYEAIQSAWQASDVGAHDRVAQAHEEGGWVFMNLIDGSLSTEPAKAEGTDYIRVEPPPEVANSVLVAIFHTHPALGRPAPPSRPDIKQDTRRGVPNLVAGNTGTKTDVFQIRLSGPPARKHLASEYKIPGPSGGIAP